MTWKSDGRGVSIFFMSGEKIYFVTIHVLNKSNNLLYNNFILQNNDKTLKLQRDSGKGFEKWHILPKLIFTSYENMKIYILPLYPMVIIQYFYIYFNMHQGISTFLVGPHSHLFIIWLVFVGSFIEILNLLYVFY